MKKIPMRKCVATQEQCPKKELLRIVKTPQGTVEVDLTGKLNGRGAYLKRDRGGAGAGDSSGKVEARSGMLRFPEEVYDKIREVLGE